MDSAERLDGWLPLAALRERLSESMRSLGGLALLTARVARQALRWPLDLRALSQQIESIGVRSMSVVLLTAVFSSMVITVQFELQLARFGAKEWTGNAVGVTLARELGPVLTALMVGGRVGAGIAAELGSMAVTEQIDAVRALGADPMRKLVVPRVLATLLVLPLMTAMAIVIGLVRARCIRRALEPDVHVTYFINAALRSDDPAGSVLGAGQDRVLRLQHLDRRLLPRPATRTAARSASASRRPRAVVISSVVTLVVRLLPDQALHRLRLGGAVSTTRRRERSVASSSERLERALRQHLRSSRA